MAASVFDRLDAEWRRLGRHCVPASWTEAHPPLARFARLRDVVDACRATGDPVAANAVLGDLLDLAAGDPVAARAALQALVPLAATTAGSMEGYVGWGPWATRADLQADAAAVMVELIGAGRPASAWPAAVLRSRLRDRLRTVVRRHRRHRAREAAPDRAAHPVTGLDAAHSAEHRFARLIVDAARAGALTPTAAQTVLVTTVYGWDTRGFARLTGRDPRAVRTHRRRTEHRLALLLAG